MTSKNSILFFKDLKRRSTIASNKLKTLLNERNSSNPRKSDLEHTTSKVWRKNTSEINIEELQDDQKLDLLEYSLKYEPELRTNNTINKIMNLTKNIQFFAEISHKYGEKVHYDCCRYMIKEKYEVNSTVFNQGDNASNFYIILKGSVILKCQIYDEKTKEFIEKIIGEIDVGGSFGELAILENKKRAATVICKTQCLFVSLNKSHYQNILGEFQRKELEEKVNFIGSLSVFSHFNKKTLLHLSYYFTLKKMARNQTLYQENSLSNEIYLIKEGEFKILKRFNVERPYNKKRIINNSKESHVKYGDLPKLAFIQSFEIALIYSKEIIGEEEVLKDIRRKCTIICSSTEGKVYVLKKKDFLQRFLMDQTFFKKIEKSAEFKENLLKERVNKIIKAIADKEVIDLRYDRNPKNFIPKQKNIIEKIISIQNYYHAREKVSPHLRATPNEKIERLENYDKLLDFDKSQDFSPIENIESPKIMSAKLYNTRRNEENLKNDDILSPRKKFLIVRNENFSIDEKTSRNKDNNIISSSRKNEILTKIPKKKANYKKKLNKSFNKPTEIRDIQDLFNFPTTKHRKRPIYTSLGKPDKEVNYVDFKKEEPKKMSNQKTQTQRLFLTYLKKLLTEKTQHLSEVVKNF